MNITVSIPDDLIPSYEQFIARYHVDQRFDPKTGAMSLVPKFNVEEFIVHHINILSDRVDDEFPPPSTAEMRAQIERIKQQMSEQRKAVKVS